jgi:hypothetical protein
MNWAKTILQMQQEGFFVPKVHVANNMFIFSAFSGSSHGKLCHFLIRET